MVSRLIAKSRWVGEVSNPWTKKSLIRSLSLTDTNSLGVEDTMEKNREGGALYRQSTQVIHGHRLWSHWKTTYGFLYACYADNLQRALCEER
ncbi:hypothetical protein CON53_24110 [Bacillus cereus]|nr:hypothetical protein CON44_32575 [Bacillus cereus]PEE15510.1 hypothetical protein CON53_24110 [Bacillus cereus]PEQ27695.1 hypothetical protein CN467_29880 [Bacillus cereus]PEX90065.1 hypothetical protein CN465_26095 [Bacillus cereus]PFH94842.1 hypothetical protein COI81_00015 [Bacillus cereus]